jgi:hypothetical protein
MDTPTTLHRRLIVAVNEYDRQQRGTPHYNPQSRLYYYVGIGKVIGALGCGAALADALAVGFCGSLLRQLATGLGLDHQYAPHQ